MVASGVTNREAGARLFLSAKTIEAHLGRIYRKLGVRSRTELAARVAQEGLGEDVARTAVAAASRRVATDDRGRAAAR
jgi:FixJ family two-component response regulator